MPYRPRHQSRRGCSCLGRILTFLLLVALLCYPFAEPYMLETESVSISSADLPRDVGQLRVVYLSDIHAGFFFSQSRVSDLVQSINRLNADLVLLGGDYAQDSDGAIAFFKALPSIHARYGVFGVMGNHDRTMPESNLQLLRAAMMSAGVTPLVNDVASVRIVKLMTFGAFAEVVPGVDGLIHISQIADRRIEKPEDVLSEGQMVDAKITAIDEEKHKISLSLRALLAPVAEESAEEAPVEE